jgi:hypothetical protein
MTRRLSGEESLLPTDHDGISISAERGLVARRHHLSDGAVPSRDRPRNMIARSPASVSTSSRCRD